MHLSTSSRSIFASMMIISSSSNGVSTDADADDADDKDGADGADDACGERNGFILEFIVARSYRQIPSSNHIANEIITYHYQSL